MRDTHLRATCAHPKTAALVRGVNNGGGLCRDDSTPSDRVFFRSDRIVLDREPPAAAAIRADGLGKDGTKKENWDGEQLKTWTD